MVYLMRWLIIYCFDDLDYYVESRWTRSEAKGTKYHPRFVSFSE